MTTAAPDPLRPYRPDDRAAMYAVCLQTAATGGDATPLHRDHSLPGKVWVGPYVEFEPDLAFVLDDGAGVQGYVLGSLDTRAFEARLAAEWMPPLQRLHAADEFEPDTRDAALVRLIHQPMVAPVAVVDDYPSHLHIDLLPRWQGGGWGRRLIDTLLRRLTEQGSPGVFLGVNPENEHAVGFYRHLGFEPVSTHGGLWLARSLGT